MSLSSYSPYFASGRKILISLLFIVPVNISYAVPITLTDAELDRISAGLVNLDVSGKAVAKGPNAVSRFSANVEQSSSSAQPDQYIYTTTTGLVNVFAKGKKVYAEVGYSLRTDEEILSLDVIHKSSLRTSGAKKGSSKKAAGGKKKDRKNRPEKRSRSEPNRRKNSKDRSARPKGRVSRERQSLYINVVTRKAVD